MPSSDMLDTIVDYIAVNYMDSITIEDLERVAGMSRFVITRQFQRTFKDSPMRWIWRFRVDKAASLLCRYPEMPCRDIAYFCGFGSPSHFCRLFRGMRGSSPSLFRAMDPAEPDQALYN
jgi:AraC-like DNA-binding protein